jgi:hypothetical protein
MKAAASFVFFIGQIKAGQFPEHPAKRTRMRQDSIRSGKRLKFDLRNSDSQRASVIHLGPREILTVGLV